MMNSVRSLWLAFMATPRWVRWLAQGLVMGMLAALGYYTVLQPERAAVERLRHALLHSSEAHAALVRRFDDFPALATLQQQWDALPDKPVYHAALALTERLLPPLSASNAALITLQPPITAPLQPWKMIVSTDFFGGLTLIQHITASAQPLHIHSLSIETLHEVLHLELRFAVPNSGEEAQW
ncbi:MULTISPECIES: hypothetical protein [unclassified Symbiopectobacterium]|uniref:hypothetical protein n=1 Tax=unclassified Symbiopectobacterium TaxID=2794573 RepID=UPI002225E861|nr:MULTISPECIES: hypothetical protein [unclassified Symbiopectobacterium]MCW2476960.1 hypothetical protein [Candidatus Symbiopectobacterium sp. NZEC151]MCW2488329.1 hypothetical protein [Candidatus Symbiopectobacterium sp. NZEC127]